MIQAKGITKRFGEKTVYEQADITVESGSICGLVGINGAGKSTLLRILSGVLKADEGVVFIDGEPVYDNPKVKRKLFFLPDDPYYDTGVTGEKLRALYRTFYPFDDEIFNRYSRTFSLQLKKPVRNFSKGMKRQLFIALALSCKPAYLLLDEAFDGLDPLARLEFKRGLIELQEAGGTIVIASHSLRELEDICDSFILVDDAEVKASGKLENALENIFKLQLAFREEISSLPFEYLRAERNGRVFTVVCRGDKEKIMANIARLDPILMEEIPMDFEDLFLEEVKSRGYLQ